MNLYEDFYPISDEVALVVSGETYVQLTEIRIAFYKLNKNNKVIIQNSYPFIKGKHLRLGNIYEGKLYYSDGFTFEGNDKIEQPFMTDRGILFTKEMKIWLIDKVLVDHWQDYNVLGRPCMYFDWVYFEALKNTGNAPQDWEIWRYNVETKKKEFVLENAANPYIYKGHLFYSKWCYGRFDTYKKEKSEVNV